MMICPDCEHPSVITYKPTAENPNFSYFCVKCYNTPQYDELRKYYLEKYEFEMAKEFCQDERDLNYLLQI